MTIGTKAGAEDGSAREVTREIDLVRVIDQAPVSHLQWRVIFLCFMVAFVDGFDTQAIGYVAPKIMREFDLGPAAMGLGFSAGLFGLMIGAAALSAAADRMGRKPTIIASCLVMAVFSLFTAFAPSFETFLLGRFLTGIGLGGAIPVINAMTAEFVPAKRRATLMTVMYAGVPMGAIAAGLFASVFSDLVGWRVIFLAGGLLPLVVALVVAAWLPESIQFLAAFPKRRLELVRILKLIDRNYQPEINDRLFINEDGARRGSFRSLFSDRRGITTLLIWIIFLCNLFIVYAIVSWMPSIFAVSGIPLKLAIFSTLLFNVGGITIGLILARLSDRWGVEQVIPWAFVGAALSIASIGPAISSPLSALAIIALVGGFVGGTQFSIHLLAVNRYPSSIRSLGLGAALSIGRVGGILGPLAVGWMLSVGWSNEILFVLAASPALIGLLAMLALRKTAPGPSVSRERQGRSA